MQTSQSVEPSGHELTRERFREELINALEFARLAQRSVGVLTIKLVRTDRLGELMGVPAHVIMQQALRRLPPVLRKADHFLVISESLLAFFLPNLKNSSQAWLAANKIQQALAAPYEASNTIITVRPVIGIACFPEHASSADDLVINADAARLVAAKTDVSIHIMQSDDRQDRESYAPLATALRRALENNELEILYQPILDTKTGRCKSAEALLRWHLPDQGTVLPPTIISIAENAGLLGLLNKWVINTVLRQQHELTRAKAGIDVNINVSTSALGNEDFVIDLQQALGTWHGDPRRITLEIREGVTVIADDQVTANLAKMHESGIRLVVDDFGASQVSLLHVDQLAIHGVKLGAAVVERFNQSKDGSRFVKALIELSHSLGLVAGANCADNAAHFKELKKLGCDTLQGDHICPALKADDLAQWLRQNKHL